MIVNIIPLAGKWQRFKDAWYELPKPLIDINWEKMIFKAFNSLPKADKNVFICTNEHIEKYSIDELLRETIDNSTIISDKFPKWQASSTYLIKDYVDNNDTINIWACDNAMLYDIDKYNTLLSDDNVDFFVWTFKNYHWINYNPDQYSYCDVDLNENIVWVSLKKTISDTPINDNCLVWAFTFKKAEFFFSNYLELENEGEKINGEYYLDSVINHCLKNWLKWKVFCIDTYIGFWTPNDLESFKYWSNYFNLIKNEK